MDDVTPLPGPGLIAGATTLESKSAAVKAFVAATIHAMQDIQANPTKGLDASIAAVPDLAADREGQAAILDATIASWTGPAQSSGGLGALDADGWAASITYLSTLKTTEGVPLVPNAVTVQDVLEEGYVPGP